MGVIHGDTQKYVRKSEVITQNLTAIKIKNKYFMKGYIVNVCVVKVPTRWCNYTHMCHVSTAHTCVMCQLHTHVSLPACNDLAEKQLQSFYIDLNSHGQPDHLTLALWIIFSWDMSNRGSSKQSLMCKFT